MTISASNSRPRRQKLNHAVMDPFPYSMVQFEATVGKENDTPFVDDRRIGLIGEKCVFRWLVAQICPSTHTVNIWYSVFGVALCLFLVGVH